MTLNKIKSRLGSISPARLNGLPISIQKLLEEDMPRLIAVAEAARGLIEDGLDINRALSDALDALDAPERDTPRAAMSKLLGYFGSPREKE